jgi:membrane-bound inhibitor of C-type lysozyme
MYPPGTPPPGASTPRPLPATGPILYSCADGTQLTVNFTGDSARVAIVGGTTMVLPRAGAAGTSYFSNGRYGLRGGGTDAQWEVGRMAPVPCRGS